MGEKKEKKDKDKKHKKHKDKKDKKHKKHKKDKKEKKDKRDHKKQESSSSSDSDVNDSQTNIGPQIGASIGPQGGPQIGPDIGPQIGPQAGPQIGPDIGPQIGPNLGPQAGPPGVGGDESEEDAGPPRAGEEEPAKDAGSEGVAATGGGEKRRAGPMMPALPDNVDLEALAYESAKVDWKKVAEEEEEEEDDLVGPVMEGQVSKGYIEATIAAGRKAQSAALAKMEEAEESRKPRHEDWMTQLPTVGPFTQTIDDMGKNRFGSFESGLRDTIRVCGLHLRVEVCGSLLIQFFHLAERWTCRNFSRKEKEGRGDTSAWTDTPADKDRKARERAMGIKGGNKRKEPEGPTLSQTVDEGAASLVSQYNAALRPKSLVEMHQEEMRKKQKPGEAKGSVTPGGWDRAELSQPRMKDQKQADQLFASAQGLSGRFSGNSFHGV